MAKISANGDRPAIKLRKENGAYVVITEQGRLLAQTIPGDGYKLIDRHWIRAGAHRTDRASIVQYLIEKRYPGAVEVRS